jgi:hypothetical protein
MKRFTIITSCIFILLLMLNTTILAQLTWNFTSNLNSSGAVANLTTSVVALTSAQGSTTISPINATPPIVSNYSGASGSGCANINAKAGAISTTTSTYVQVILTPATNYWVNITNIKWGSFAISASGGPTTFAIYTSLNNYTTPVFVTNPTIAANSTWSQINTTTSGSTPMTPIVGLAGAAVTIRIYAYGGTGTPLTGTTFTSANWRIDDLVITATAQTGITGQIPKYSAPGVFTNSVINESTDGNIGIGVAGPTSGGAKLDVGGTIKSTGLIIPTGAVANKVLTSDASGNATWQLPTGSTNYWTLAGNGVDISNNNTGNVGIGTNTPTEKLDVNGLIKSTDGLTYGTTFGASLGTWGTFSRLTTTTSTDAFSVLTTKPTSSILLQVNNGNRGIMLNGGTKNLLFVGGSGETLSGIGNNDGTGNLTFLYATSANNQVEGMRLSNTGNLGIATTSPTEKLDVFGNIKFSGALMPNNNSGISGQVLTSAGTGVPPTWTTPPTNAPGWGLNGNAGTSSTNYIGTSDAQDLRIRTNGEDKIFIQNNTGNIGIGTSNPTEKLDVLGTVKVSNLIVPNTNSTVIIGSPSDNGYANKLQVTGVSHFNGGILLSDQPHASNNFTVVTGPSTSAPIKLNIVNGVGYGGANMLLGGTQGGGGTPANPNIYFGDNLRAYASIGGELKTFNNLQSGDIIFSTTPNVSTTSLQERFRIDQNGNVGVGISLPTEKLDVNGNIYTNGKILIGTTGLNTGTHSLAVNGSAIFTKAVVKLTSAPWPDYVFAPSYKLPSLTELEKYIKLNNHLPEMPSADEVKNNGIDLGNNQTLLLKKVEELTLYIIEQNKKIELLQEEKEKIAKLQAQMDELKKLIKEQKN